MAGHIVFHGLNINRIIDDIKVTSKTNHTTNAYLGGTGSDTNYVSSNGRVITCKSLCTNDETAWQKEGHRISEYIELAKTYSKKSAVLTSSSTSNIDGNYIITNFDFTEDTNHNYIIDWEFTEVTKFNATEKTFRVWGKAVSSTTTAKKTTTKTSSSSKNLSSNVKYLLKTCGTMKKGSNSKKCVQSLQKFLQSKGYYKGYKVDGSFGVYTEKAVKSLQKANKLKATGQWDKNTRSYWQKKYKYP